MYSQLGTTIFDGYKSYVSFSIDEEAILVEHALIGRKPRLEGSGLSLQTVSISLFLHQEFCHVEEEIAALRKSKDSFEILKLIWGTGKVEGSFVIKQMTTEKTQQDNAGNTYAATVDLVLKESVNDNVLDQQQQAAQKNAFAVGNKQPATKSKRVNLKPCESQISGIISQIQSWAGAIDHFIHYVETQGDKVTPGISTYCKNIMANCQQLDAAFADPTSCIANNTAIFTNSTNVEADAKILGNDVLQPILDGGVTIRSENTTLQADVKKLITAASAIINKSITRG